MAFTKVALMAVAAISANVSFAKQEHVSYTCSVQGALIATFTVAFDRDPDWAASWDWDANWDMQPTPSFSSSVILTIPGMDQQGGTVRGVLIGGHTRVTGYTQVTISAATPGILELSLLERPHGNSLFGHGTYLNSDISINCSVTRR